MKKIITVLALTCAASSVFASGVKPILCENIDAKVKGPYQCDHFLIEERDGRLALLEYNKDSGNSCGFLSWISVDSDDSTAIKFSGTATSRSSGFNVPTRTSVEMNINKSDKTGLVVVRETKLLTKTNQYRIANCN